MLKSRYRLFVTLLPDLISKTNRTFKRHSRQEAQPFAYSKLEQSGGSCKLERYSPLHASMEAKKSG